MVLCDLCRYIPFHGMPSLPSRYRSHTQPGPGLILFIPQDGGVKPVAGEERWGYPHHVDFEGLLNQDVKMLECAICSLLHEAVSRFKASWENAQRDKSNTSGYKKATPTDRLLRLTERYSSSTSGPGFMVWILAQKAHVFLVAVVGFGSRNENDPLAASFRGWPINEDPSSEPSLTRACNWVQKCDTEHEGCRAKDVPLPTRVLDLGDPTPSSSPNYIIKLWETEGARGSYTALSYCWGKSQNFTTTRSTINARKQGMDLTEMPKTFKDAVTLTRRLNVRLLWIDSLCICQGDRKDWEREASRMQDVYKNAYLTIAATAVHDSSQGCFINRNPPKYVMFDYVPPPGVEGRTSSSSRMYAYLIQPLSKAARPSDRLQLQGEPLSSRAWTLQERLLSRRVLHYARDQMHYECNDAFLSEDGYRNPQLFISLPVEEQTLAPSSGWEEGSSQDMRDIWNKILDIYGSRQLTEHSDRLPALSGIVKRFHSKFYNDEYIAGLWRSTLIGDLLWDMESVSDKIPWPPPERYRGPSWSWATVKGSRSPMKRYRLCHKLASLIDYNVQVEGENPYGTVPSDDIGSCWIKLQAPPLIPIFVVDKKSKKVGRDEEFFQFQTVTGDPKGSPHGTYLDYQIDEVTLKHLPLFALILGVDKEGSKKEEVLFPGIVVTPSEKKGSLNESNGEDEKYRRLGYLLMNKESLGTSRPDVKGTTYTTITLV